MKELFTNIFNYKCRISKNRLTKDDLDDFFDRTFVDENLRQNSNNYDGIIICLFGHGLSNDRYETSDFEYEYISNIQNKFNGNNLKKFIGFPKIIFIDTCRGGNKSYTHQYRQKIKYIPKQVSRGTEINELIWSHSSHDIMTVYSTVPDYEIPDCSYLSTYLLNQYKQCKNKNSISLNDILFQMHHKIRKKTGVCCIQQVHTMSYHLLLVPNKK